MFDRDADDPDAVFLYKLPEGTWNHPDPDIAKKRCDAMVKLNDLLRSTYDGLPRDLKRRAGRETSDRRMPWWSSTVWESLPRAELETAVALQRDYQGHDDDDAGRQPADM